MIVSHPCTLRDENEIQKNELNNSRCVHCGAILKEEYQEAMKKTIAIPVFIFSAIALSGCSGRDNANQAAQIQTQPDSLKNTRLETQPLSQPRNDASANGQSSSNNANNSDSKNIMELEIKTTQPGTGTQEAKAGDTVSVQYTGKLIDGTKFDSSYDRGGKPFSFTVGAGQVIKGWDQGLLGAKAGEKRTLTIPSDLAYGANGIPGVIPGGATLVFDVEVISIK